MRWVAMTAMGMVLAVAPAAAQAATWGVSNTTDTPVGQACAGFTGCSLREAVTSTEANPGADAILVSGGTYPLTNGQLTVTQDLAISRVGAGAATIQGSGSRILNVTGSGTALDLRFMTLANGSATDAGGAVLGGAGTTLTVESTTIRNSTASGTTSATGGAISSQGAVSLVTASGSITGTAITNNTATASDANGTARGGGVYAEGTLNVGARTAITGNKATGTDATSSALGGGIFPLGSVSLNQTTVAGNSAKGGSAAGGGIATESSTVNLTRTTLSGNTATGTGDSVSGGGGFAVDPQGAGAGAIFSTLSTIGNNTVTLDPSAGPSARAFGGAIYNGSSAINTIVASTIAGNAATAPDPSMTGAGAFAGSGLGQFNVAASIVAENTQSSGNPCRGATLSSGGYNVLGATTGCTYSAATGDVTDVTDAGLDPLDDNGGLTDTFALTPTSTARNRVDAASTLCSSLTTDQRGFPRPKDGNCDSGSVEMNAVPTLATTASPDVPLGGQVHDTATLAGGANPTGTITFRLYGPDDATCAGTPVFTDTKTVSGNNDYSSADFTPTATGTYRWAATYSGDGNNDAAVSGCNASGESVVVDAAATTLTTKASSGVTLGGQVHDTATLAGGSSPTGTITFRLYGPNDATCAGTPAFTATATVAGNGDYTSPDFTPSATGTYRWTASYDGDANNDPATSACNAAGESVVVAAAAPTLSTTASPGVTLGGPVSDQVTLAGGVSPSGTITFRLFGPDDATCTGAPAFTGTATVSGNGDYGSPTFTPTAAGTYRWTASYSGDANNNAATGACNATGESVTVASAPSTTTTTTIGTSSVAPAPIPLVPSPVPACDTNTFAYPRVRITGDVLSFRFTPPCPDGTLRTLLTTRRLGARSAALRPGRNRMAVGATTSSLADQAVAVRVRLNRAGRKALAVRGKLPVRLTLVYTPDAGVSGRQAEKFVIR